MKKIYAYINELNLPTKLLIGSIVSFLFFLLRKLMQTESSENLWGSNLLQWMSIPIILLAVTIPFFILYLLLEKKEPIRVQYVVSILFTIAGLVLFFML